MTNTINTGPRRHATFAMPKEQVPMNAYVHTRTKSVNLRSLLVIAHTSAQP